MKIVHMCELSQKVPQVAVGENFNSFDFFKSFLKGRKSSYSLQDTYNIKIHSFGWKMCTCEFIQKGSPVCNGRTIFSIFF